MRSPMTLNKYQTNRLKLGSGTMGEDNGAVLMAGGGTTPDFRSPVNRGQRRRQRERI